MLHTCVQRFDVTGNLEKFGKILGTKLALVQCVARGTGRDRMDLLLPSQFSFGFQLSHKLYILHSLCTVTYIVAVVLGVYIYPEIMLTKKVSTSRRAPLHSPLPCYLFITEPLPKGNDLLLKDLFFYVGKYVIKG